MDIPATSLPGGKPSGTVFTFPVRPFRAAAFMFGLFAAMSGVFPPSSSSGKSAMPSPITTMYFMR